MFKDNKLSVWGGLRPWILRRVSKRSPFQDRDSLVLSGNHVFKRFQGDVRPDEFSRGAPQSGVKHSQILFKTWVSRLFLWTHGLDP